MILGVPIKTILWEIKRVWQLYLHIKDVEKVILYIPLYVGNNLMTSSSKEEINNLKEKFIAEFEMEDNVVAKRILGINVVRNQNKGAVFFSQFRYLKKWQSSLGCMKLSQLTLLWVITQTFLVMQAPQS